MNSIFFGLKRAYYATHRSPRKPLALIGMTMARYDMMYTIGRYSELLQKELRRILGVAGATVSRMLKALEERGLVVRAPASDRRSRLVRLSAVGWRKLAEADRLEIEDPEGNDATRPFLEIPNADGRWYWLLALSGTIEEYEAATDRMVRELGPTFGPYPRWHPED